MIDFTSVNITEPPLSSNFTFEEINEIVGEGKNYDTDIYYIPCHTQAVERGVKLVTKASHAGAKSCLAGLNSSFKRFLA